jgi:hypothetical protein
VKVSVESRISTSISPACSTVKRVAAVVPVVLHLVRIAQHGGGDGAAIVDVDAVPDALVVLEGKARHARVDAAVQRAALLDRLDRRPRRRRDLRLAAGDSMAVADGGDLHGLLDAGSR